VGKGARMGKEGGVSSFGGNSACEVAAPDGANISDDGSRKGACGNWWAMAAILADSFGIEILEMQNSDADVLSWMIVYTADI
jgi:hypothetical protein